MNVIVVGAGVFGASAALELRGRGHEVTIVDPGPLPHRDASSTDVSKMVRMDYGADVFYHEMAEASLDGWDRWNERWPRPLYHETGFLVLSRGTMEAGGFEYESLRTLRARGYAPEITGGERLQARCPDWVGAEYPEGYVSRRGGWAESGAVVEQLLVLGQAAGVTHRAARCEGLLEEAGRVTGVRTSSGAPLRADLTIVCAGAWTAELLPWLRDVMWATGQPVVHFQVDDPERYGGDRFPPFAADIARSGWYGFPALDDGRVKIAHHAAGRRVIPSRRGEVGAAHETRTREFLAGAIPSLAHAPAVWSRVCLYCDTFDGDLWIDHDPDRAGLVVAAGGSGHGFKFAPLLGPLIADVVEGEHNRWAHRFRWRTLGALKTEAARFDGA